MDLRLILNHDLEDPLSQTPHTPVNPAASGGRGTSEKTSAVLKKLYLSPTQQDAIRSLYARNQEFKKEFDTSPASQASAQQLLRMHGLSEAPDLKGAPSGCECWMTASSNTWGSNTGRKKRIIFQCICGYDTAARQSRDRRGSQNPLKWTRHTDYEFGGCLAHADVTWNLASKQVERVIGHFEHCAGCAAAPVIHQYISQSTISSGQKNFNGPGSVSDEQRLGERPTYSIREFSGLHTAASTHFDNPEDARGYVRYQ